MTAGGSLPEQGRKKKRDRAIELYKGDRGKSRRNAHKSIPSEQEASGERGASVFSIELGWLRLLTSRAGSRKALLQGVSYPTSLTNGGKSKVKGGN